MDIGFNDLKVGESCEVTGYKGADKSYRAKLLSMGLTRGTTFVFRRIAPMGDPVEIEIRGFNLSLRKDEAGMLEFRRLDS